MSKKEKIRIIKDNDKFDNIFNIKPEKKNKSENFEKLLSEYDNNPNIQKMYERKMKLSDDNRMSIAERIKYYPSPQDTLDLHGLTSDEAEAITLRFIDNSERKDFKTLRIITGKGIHSIDKPVLRDKLEILSNKLKKEKTILFWKWEKKHKEKSGAIIIFLN